MEIHSLAAYLLLKGRICAEPSPSFMGRKVKITYKNAKYIPAYSLTHLVFEYKSMKMV